MYAVILGTVVLIIVTMLRQAAETVDGAQEAALQRYDLAARQHATEIERVKVDALVHDSVLTTLLSAAAATTPEEQALAARMARDAVDRLDEADAVGPRSPDRVGLHVLVRRLRAALTTFSAPFTVRVVNAGGVELPVEAVDALYTAAVQAMVNSMQHADEPRPRCTSRAAHPRRPRGRLRHRDRRQRRRLRSRTRCPTSGSACASRSRSAWRTPAEAPRHRVATGPRHHGHGRLADQRSGGSA